MWLGEMQFGNNLPYIHRFYSRILFLRVSGKMAVAQMHTFDLLYLFVLTNIISTPVEVNNVGKALTYAAIIVIIYKIFLRLSLHNKLRWLLYESTTVLIRNGDIDRKGLKKVRMPMNELLSHLRVKGSTDTQNIAIAAMEETDQQLLSLKLFWELFHNSNSYCVRHL
jgi:uncharacterized membrane protein YcaP (DUF421 family)